MPEPFEFREPCHESLMSEDDIKSKNVRFAPAVQPATVPAVHGQKLLQYRLIAPGMGWETSVRRLRTVYLTWWGRLCRTSNRQLLNLLGRSGFQDARSGLN